MVACVEIFEAHPSLARFLHDTILVAAARERPTGMARDVLAQHIRVDGAVARGGA